MDYPYPGWRHSDEAIRAQERELERLRRDSTAVTSLTKQTESLKKNLAELDDRQQRMDDRAQNRELIRRLLTGNQGFGNMGRGYLGPGNLRRRDDMYTGDELGRQIERERHGGYPNSYRNCLCGGECEDDCCHRRRRSPSKSRSKRRYSSSPQQVNVIGPVYVDGYQEPESVINCYEDDFWPRSPPIDIYKKRWCGLLPDKRLPWLPGTTDLVLDGNDVLRFPKRRRREYSHLPYYYH